MAVEIPEDIILEILYRLPVKSIKRFACVSKRWESLFSDPEFGKTHFELASKSQTLTHRLLFRDVHSHRYLLQSLDLETPWSLENSPPVRSINVRFDWANHIVYILGSRKGLVACMIFRYGIHVDIWNPSTGFFKRLPQPKIVGVVGCLGFGYVSATEDYKILLSTGAYCRLGIRDKQVLIFSSKAGVWREIDPPMRVIRKNITLRHQGVLLNETLHWIGEGQHLIAFDLANHEFRQMLLPNEVHGQTILGFVVEDFR